ncbi:hypothetical protein HAX39_25460 [Citrobacter freundii]|nr:hypothetical protein [Citrobacter freundii]
METKRIVAVTACPTGIAHTFMAARRIEERAKEQGFIARVETLGSDGVKHRLSTADIAGADAVVLAVDVPVQDAERFEGIPCLKVRTQELIKHTDVHMKKALSLGKISLQTEATAEAPLSAYQVASLLSCTSVTEWRSCASTNCG